MVSPSEVAIPQALEAERAVLGCAMQSGEALRDAAEILNSSDFYSPAHATVFASLCDLGTGGQTPDPMLLFTELKRINQLERVGGAAYLHTLMQTPATAVNITHFARQVRHANRARQVLAVNQRLTQALEEQADDPDALMTAVAQQSLALELLADEQAYDAPLPGYGPVSAFLAQADDPLDWIVPGVVERQDVVLLLSTEGGGKSWLCRQICLCIAAGVSPFRPEVFQIPQRTLLVDLENAPSMVRREMRPMNQQIQYLSGNDTDRMTFWSRPGGLNLRVRADALMLERAVAESGAALVGLGSLYKAFKRKGDDWDTAAGDVRDVLDRIRTRHNCAFVLEHHMPKGSGVDRPQTAYGSSEWARWASVGRIINQVGPNMWALNAFRGDRGKRDIPVGLAHGGELPWTSVWDQTEFENGMWPELQAKLNKTRR